MKTSVFVTGGPSDPFRAPWREGRPLGALSIKGTERRRCPIQRLAPMLLPPDDLLADATDDLCLYVGSDCPDFSCEEEG